ncbi:hypothetical protein FKW77_008776 [Venturia effusa]|uniref:Autophagy-related protein 27 n=1 Tax=Venturia effusa TaxID=50376 RepID=A0A517L1V2_9PEZI|nr:hypothetical protein FKW77_008776 [Venturia effusa]
MPRIPPALMAFVAFFQSLSTALAEPAADTKPWRTGDLIPVTCLNRTLDTGEHITDTHGNLQYIPFPTCDETKRPLELRHGLSTTLNCTFTMTDPLFHTFEFYIHNDAPLSCRIPSSPLSNTASDLITGAARSGSVGAENTAYTPLIMGLSGTLQLSHVHIAHELNMLLHTDPSPAHKNKIESAAAYSISPSTKNTKLIIGDSLTMTFHIRWYQGSYLPASNLKGYHGFWSTVSYCLFAAGASAAVCIVYFRGIDLPRRLRFHGSNRLGGGRDAGLPKYNGYGYGVNQGMQSNGNGYGMTSGGFGNGYGIGTGLGKKD